MDDMDRRQLVGLLRQAIKPLIKDIVVEKMTQEITASLKLDIAKLNSSLEKHSTSVNIDASDLHTAVQELTKYTMQQELKKSQSKQLEVTDYQPHDQKKKGVYKYAGFVRPDGSWYIQRIAKDEQRYIFGKGNYSEAWSEAEAQKYGTISGEF